MYNMNMSAISIKNRSILLNALLKMVKQLCSNLDVFIFFW